MPSTVHTGCISARWQRSPVLLPWQRPQGQRAEGRTDNRVQLVDPAGIWTFGGETMNSTRPTQSGNGRTVGQAVLPGNGEIPHGERGPENAAAVPQLSP